MTDIFLPLEEAAMLESIKYKTLSRRLIANPELYKTVAVTSGIGGKDRILVSLSSLSGKAQKAWQAMQEAEVEPEPSGPEVPWYVDVDIHWYMEAYPAQYHQAVELCGRIQEFATSHQRQRTAFADRFAADLGMSQRSLYRYTEKYLEATAWAMKLERERGCGYDYLKVLALCRKPKQANTFPSLPPEQRAYLENIWFSKGFAANRGTVEMLYTQFEAHALLEGWTYPSYKTVARYINHLLDDQMYRNAHRLAADGLRAWKRDVMVKGIRDTTAVPVMGLLQGDAHKFDFWVKYTDPRNGKVSAIRPTLIAWIDTRSRKVMGAIMAKSINAQITKHSLLKVAYTEGVPECILIDNGKEFTAREITGRHRNQRSDHEDDPEIMLDTEARGFLKSLGIRDDYRSLPYQPWGKGPIERFFLTVCNQFSKWFLSYTGTLTGSRTAAKVQKNVRKLLEQDKLITLEECYERFMLFLDTYHNKAHRGLRDMGEQWTTPAQLFENAEERYIRPAPDIRFAEILLQKTEKVWVSPSGIRRFGRIFMDAELEPYINSHVKIRWNPEDLSRVFVYTMKGKRICEAAHQPYLQYFATQEETAEHKRKQNRHLSRDRAILREATTPYEARTGGTATAGKMDFMIENKEPRKVVALPDDRQYREETRQSGGKKRTGSKFLNEKGSEALSKLKAMGE